MKIRDFAAAGQAFTSVPTAFLADELPDAPSDYVKVYLYGLYLAGLKAPMPAHEMEEKLHMTGADIEGAFSYWEKRGAVSVGGDGTVVYSFGSAPERKEPYPYVAFNLQVSEILGRDPEAFELRRMYSWMETYGFPQDVVLMLVRHCVDCKGNRVHVSYMDKVARGWADQHVDSVQKAQNEIDAYRAQSSGARQVMIRMGCVNQKPGKTELDLYEKWTRELGFTHEGIIRAMKGIEFSNTSAPFRFLDAILAKFHDQGAHTAQEIARLDTQREKDTGEVKEAFRALGIQPGHLTPSHYEAYKSWVEDGYTPGIILLACGYASRYRSPQLSRVTATLATWRKAGLTEEADICKMLREEAAIEAQIQELYGHAGIERTVSEMDFKFYRKYTEDYKMNSEVLDYAAELSSVADNPFRYMQTVLERWAAASVTSVSEAKAECKRYQAAIDKKKRAGKPALSYAQRPPMTTAEADQINRRTLQALQERYGTP